MNEISVKRNDEMIMTGKNLKYAEKAVSQYRFVTHKSHREAPGIETTTLQQEAGHYPSASIHSFPLICYTPFQLTGACNPPMLHLKI